jgi:hypothetical protein
MEGARRVMRRLDALLTAALPGLGAPGHWISTRWRAASGGLTLRAVAWRALYAENDLGCSGDPSRSLRDAELNDPSFSIFVVAC